MKHLQVSLKLAVLVGLATISPAFGAKNIQLQTLVTQQTSTVLYSEIPTTKTSQNSQSPQLVVIPMSKTSVLAQTANGGVNAIVWIFLLGGVAIAIAATAVTLREVVVIGENEIGIVYKKFALLRGFLPANRRIALNGEAGYQAHTLGPGRHWNYWSWMYTIRKEPVITIAQGEIGLVFANDGVPLPPGRMFSQVVECKNFQDANKFLENGGQMGKQLAILIAGTYRINTELFSIRKESAITISSGEIGLVFANDGTSLPPGRMFGQVVECNNFQDANKFLENGGQMGKQLAILIAGTYQINTDLFSIRKQAVINILPEEIALIVANDGATLPPGRMFGQVVECNNFQDANKFLENGGQMGKQLTILTTGSYQINTDLFNIRKQVIINVLPEEIALIVANDGTPLPPGRMFGQVVECNNFQDGRAFLENGGQMGKQLAILSAGTYQINTDLFTIRKQSVITISSNEIALVIANDGASMPQGRMFAQVAECNNFQDGRAFLENGGQKGKQLTILTTGTYQINTDLFTIRKQPIISIPPGEIGLVVAKDGAPLPPGRMLGKVVECNNFQDACAFLENGGQKGKQLAILSAGTYQINTELFTVITAANATQYDMKPEDFWVYTVDSDHIGIVTTLDGAPLPAGEIAGSYIINGHNKFQDGQKFIDGNGYRGLQEEVLPEGSWNLNPWLVKLEQVPLTNISAGAVGVIISHIGKTLENKVSDESVESRYKLVEAGYKGVWQTPVYPGKYPINTRVMSVEIVPTHEITLDWSNKPKPASNYDGNLHALKLRSKDGFLFDIEVTQVINIAPENAPKMISRVGSPSSRVSEPMVGKSFDSTNSTRFNSIRNLVTRVLEPMVGNYFRNSAQDYEALDFQNNRTERQQEAIDHIESALDVYGVKAVGTFINEIDLPDELEKTLTDGKIAKEQRKTIKEEILTEQERQNLVRERGKTDMEKEVAKKEKELEIAKLENQRQIEEANTKAIIADAERKTEAEWKRIMNEIEMGQLREKVNIEAELKRLVSEVDVNALLQTIEQLSPELYAKLESDKAFAEAIGKMNVPGTIFNTSGNSSGASEPLQTIFPQLLAAQLLQSGLNPQNSTKQLNNLQPIELSPAQPSELLKLKVSLSQTTEPRCPIVLLVDTSKSMSGECIDKLIQGMLDFKQELMQDIKAAHRVEVAVIKFGASAQMLQDFTSVESFLPPPLEANGKAVMGKGIELALNKLETRKNAYSNNGIEYYQPWIFLLTGSSPTDSWQSAARHIQRSVDNHQLNFFVVGIQGADMYTLSQITHNQCPPVMLKGWKFQELFHWLADALKRVSSSNVGDKVDLPPIGEWASRDGVYRQ